VQGYDRYAFVNNNPVRYTDPSGHRPCDGVYGCQNEQVSHKVGKSDKWREDKGYAPIPTPCKSCHDSPAQLFFIEPSHLGQETVPPGNYDDWYHGGSNDSVRTPDYYTLTPTLSFPGAGLLVNVLFPFTIDRFGNIYGGVGVSFGPKSYAFGVAGTWVGGYVLDVPPGEARTERYLSGVDLNTGGGFIFGGAYNTSLSQYNSDQSWEGGVYLPNLQFSAILYYSWKLIDNTAGKPIWK